MNLKFSGLMANTIRPTAGQELKDALQVIDADPFGWWAIHTALVSAARQVVAGASEHVSIARTALKFTTATGFGAGRPDASSTRYTGMPIMAWQDALYVVNELTEWRFPDDVLLIGWLLECGGPEMGRGPARASYQDQAVEHYIGKTRRLYNEGTHGNGPGWPESREWTPLDCRYMVPAAGFRHFKPNGRA